MFKIENYDNVLNAIDELFKYYFKVSYQDLEELEDGIYYAYDTSMHGSQHYQYKLITNDIYLINIYRDLVKLRDNIFKYSFEKEMKKSN